MAQSALMLNAAMVLIGIGCSAIYMGALYIFGRTEAPERFALLSSWLIGIGSAGNLLAATPLAWAATLIGWRGAMLAMAAASAASAISIFLLIRDPPRLVTKANTVGFFKGVASILSIRSLWPLLPLTAAGYAIILAERGLWAGPYFSEVHGLDPVGRGNALLIMAIAMSLGAMIYARSTAGSTRANGSWPAAAWPERHVSPGSRSSMFRSCRPSPRSLCSARSA
ncbi:MAG: hypothetical protein HC855_07765 [Rhizobiales bacterium]|nr:hypothetical protein [Hyphomicrobiales bacterium]